MGPLGRRCQCRWGFLRGLLQPLPKGHMCRGRPWARCLRIDGKSEHECRERMLCCRCDVRVPTRSRRWHRGSKRYPSFLACSLLLLSARRPAGVHRRHQIASQTVIPDRRCRLERWPRDLHLKLHRPRGIDCTRWPAKRTPGGPEGPGLTCD